MMRGPIVPPGFSIEGEKVPNFSNRLMVNGGVGGMAFWREAHTLFV